MIEESTIFKGIFKRVNFSYGYVYVEKIGRLTIDEYNKKNNSHIENLKIFVRKYNQDFAVSNCSVKVALDLSVLNNKKLIEQINSGKYNESKESLEGIIIDVKLGEDAKIVGTFSKSATFGFVTPLDPNFPSDIFIPKKYISNAKQNDRVVVQIIKKATTESKCEGKIVEVLGNANDLGVDILSIVKEAQIPYEFPQDVLEQAKKIEQEVNIDEIKNRQDFRGDNIFTIDGDDTKDIDDAITCKKLDDGSYILNVHIADVSNYVKDDSPLDKEALKRGTSVYLLDRVIPMLPVELSNGICSLNEGEDRFALSCLMKIDKDGNVKDYDIVKTIIKVTKRMTYKKVQDILDGKEEVCNEYKEYIEDFKTMEELAKILKKKREEDGYLSLKIPETKIYLNEKGKIQEIREYESYFSNEIIEQFMLIANICVAEKFYFLNAPFIYRVHNYPDYEKVIEAKDQLKAFGIDIKIKDKKVYSKEFEKALNSVKKTPLEEIVSEILLHTLKNAIYSNKCEGHFGIGANYYCHFTSPIRRYPDLFVHRVISNYIDQNYYLDTSDYDKLEEQAKQRANISTECEKTATQLERRVNKVKCCEYMEDKLNKRYKGIIVSVLSFGMFVRLDNSIEGLVKYSNFPFYIEHTDGIAFIEDAAEYVFKPGDKVEVKVIDASKERETVDFELKKDFDCDYDEEEVIKRLYL